LPTEFSKEAPDSKELGRLTVFPVNNLGEAPAKTFRPTAFGVPAYLRFCIDKEPFSPSVVAAKIPVEDNSFYAVSVDGETESNTGNAHNGENGSNGDEKPYDEFLITFRAFRRLGNHCLSLC
jgi:hypothetical protein